MFDGECLIFDWASPLNEKSTSIDRFRFPLALILNPDFIKNQASNIL